MDKKPSYTIKQEQSPALGLRYVVRLDGVRIGSAGSKQGAEQVKREHQEAVKAAADRKPK